MGLPRLIVSAGPPSVLDGNCYPRWNGLPRVIGVNGGGVDTYYGAPIWLNALKQCGSNARFTAWFTGNSSISDTNEEAYLQRDANDNVTSLIAGNGFSGTQQFNKAYTFVYVNMLDKLPPGTAVDYTAGQWTLSFEGPGTFTLGNDVASVATSSPGLSVSGKTITSTMAMGQFGSVTFTAAGEFGFSISITALPNDGVNYLRFSTGYLVPTAYLSQYLAGEILHPAYKGMLASYTGPVRFMGPLNTFTNNQMVTFTADLANGATSGTISTIKWVGASISTWQRPTGTYKFVFATGQAIDVSCTYGAAAVTWTTPLSAAVPASSIGGMAFFSARRPWAQRKKPSAFSWSQDDGPPWEVIATACKEVSRPLWLNVPGVLDVADPTYTGSLAALMHDGTGADISGSNLPAFSGLKERVFPEWDNETWNSVYYVFAFCAMMGNLNGYYAAQGNNSAYGGQEYYGQRVGAMCDVFSSAYGADFASMVCVNCPTQFAAAQGPAFLKVAMNGPDAGGTPPWQKGISSIGCAPYFGIDGISGADAGTIMGLADPIGEVFSIAYSNVGASGSSYSSISPTGWAQDAINTMTTWVSQVRGNGQPWATLPIICYEGGSALDDATNIGAAWRTVLTNVQRDPRFQYLYYDPNHQLSTHNGYLESLRLLGISFICQLGDISPSIAAANQAGAGGWGALENVMQTVDAVGNALPLSQTPSKYQGLIAFASHGPGSAYPQIPALGVSAFDTDFAVGSLSTQIRLAGAPADATTATASLTTASAPVAPILLYTDIVSGSATNNEFGAGAYLRLYLLNAGTWSNVGTASGAQVTIGGQPIANYRYLQPAPTNGVRPGLPNTMCLCVQVGSTAVQALTPGTAYQIGVTVNGIAANTVDTVGNSLTFTIQPGHFYHVNTVSGNDSTGVVDDPTHPYRYIQAWTGSAFTGLWTVLKPGDTIVPHGNGGTPITDQNGFDTRLMRFSQHAPVGGTAPTGTIGAGYIHVTAYPGAVNGNAPDDVYIFTPTGGEGGFMGAAESFTRPNSPNAGQYWSVSAMRTSCDVLPGSTDASNFNLQNSADFTRFVGNNISWPSTSTGAAHQKCGGIVGNGYHSWWLGNYVHDISGGDPSSLENHGLYADGSNTDAAWIEMGFNVIINCTTGQCIQFHQEASTGFHDCYIHHNYCENSAKYGMKMDGWSGIMRWWNNAVVGSNREAFQIDATGATSAGNVAFENNTLLDGYSSSSGAYLAQIANEGGNAPGTFTIRNNIIAFSASSSGFSSTWISGQTIGTISGNLYFDYSGRLTSKYSGDAAGLYGNPQFSNPATFPNSDLRIGPTSAALGRAIAATINPTNDLGMNVQPRAGQSVASVGAFA